LKRNRKFCVLAKLFSVVLYPLMIKKEDIEHLANLSRLSLTESEKTSFSRDLDSILNYVSELTELSADAPVSPRHLNDNEMRADENPHAKGLNTEDLIESADKKEKGYIKVRKVIDK